MQVVFGAQDVCDMVETGVEAVPKDVSASQRKVHKKDKKIYYNAIFLIHQSVDSMLYS